MESLTSQVASGSRNLNQNVLFGIATPQLPSWATETPSNSKPSRPEHRRQLKQWPEREAPPHLPRTSDVRRRSVARKQPDDDSPDDEGDGDDDDDGEHNSRSRSNRSRRGRRPSGRGASNTTSSSRRGRRRGGGDDSPSEPSSDGEGSSFRMDLESSDTDSNRKRRAGKIPYGSIKPTIKTEIKQEQLPRWDGNPSTAVKYFLRIQQLAALEGDLPEALGYWLWMNLEDGSDIKDWFTTLTFEEQSHMRSHYINYLRGIKDGYLGEAWQFKINRIYEGQYFRQIGHKKELPKTFIIRRIMYTRMLTSAEPGGKLEMSLIMRKAPLSWKTILVMESIKSTKALYTKVVDYEDDLLDAWRRKSTAATAVTVDNLIPTLKRLGWEQPRSHANRSNQERPPQDRRVMLTTVEEGEEQEPAEDLVDEPQEVAHDDILREVYQVMQRRQRAPPPGGYMFSRNDHVTTKMGKLPPSPCKACGSDNHWDKECPDWEVYKARTAPSKKNGYLSESAVDEGDKMYQTAFSILLSQRVAASQIDLNQVKAGFEAAVLLSEIDIPNEGVVEKRHKTRETYKTTVEEVEDEDTIHAHEKLKSEKHLLCHVSENEEFEQERPTRTKHPAPSSKSYTEPESSQHVQSAEKDNEIRPEVEEIQRNTFVSERGPIVKLEVSDSNEYAAEQEDSTIPPPPKDAKPLRMTKKRFYPTGESSVGVSVLSVKGRVGNQNNAITDLRLDSCADVTLISAEYFDSLKSAPPIQQGMRMKLWQLTDKDSTLRGFVRIPIFMTTDDGTVLESEAEAYVVPGMTVPILLGEDYQLTYEIGVTRNVEEGPRV